MKTLKQKRSRKIAMLAIAILSIIAAVCIATSPTKGIGATLAMATVVGSVTLEGKEEAIYLALKETVNSELEKHTKGYISETKMTENINAALAKFAPNLKDDGEFKALKTLVEDLNGKLAQQGLQIKAMADLNTKDVKKSIYDQIKEHKEKNKEAWEKMKQPGAPSFEIELKAAGTMLETTHIGDGVYFPAVSIEPGFVDIARQRPSLIAHVNYSSTTSRVIVWVEKINPDGNAGWTAEGGVKPLIDFEWTTTSSTAKKVTDKIKVSTEMLDDIDFIAGEITNELRYQVDIAVNTAILSGAGGDSIYGITHWASAYALTTIKTTTPNNYDCILAAATQIKTLHFTPTKAFINPIDATNMELVKTTDGVYIIPPFSTADGKRIAGLQVLEDETIPVGYILVGDMTRCKVKELNSFKVTVGWVNDDFERNLVTMIGERRMHLFIADNDSAAFVYDTFTAIKSAITQL